MKSLSVLPAAVLAILAGPLLPSAFTADGVWTGAAPDALGLWSTPENWTGNSVADGTGFTADFNTLDLVVDTTVHLDSSRTLTNLTFGDTATGTAAGWTLDNNGNSANALFLDGATPTVTVNALGAGKAVTISATIGGVAGLTKAGVGTLILSGVNAYSGATTISGGGLQIAGAGQLGSGAYADNISNGGTFTFSSSANQTLSGNISGSGAFTKDTGAGTLTLSGTNTFTGQLVVTKGSLVFDGGSWNASGTASANRNFNIGSGASAEIKNNAQITLGGWMGLGYLNNTGTGTLTLTSGSLTVKGVSGGSPSDRGMVIGEYAGTTGIFHMNGGTLTVNNTVWLGQLATGTWNMNAGTATVNKVSFGSGSGTTGTLNLSGGVLQVNGGGIAKGSGTGNFNFNGGTLKAGVATTTFMSGLSAANVQTGGAVLDTNGVNITIAQVLRHDPALGATVDGGLTKQSAGILTLSGVNTYTGATRINGGTITLTSTGTISSNLILGTNVGGNGTLDVSAKTSPYTQGSLSGVGTVNIGVGKTVNVTTVLAPGFSTGTINLTGDLNITGAATTMELAGLGGVAGTDSDFVNVSGTLTLGGNLTIAGYNGFDFTQAATYNLFDAAVFAGDFGSVNVGGNALTLTGDLWSGTFEDVTYSLNETNGVLTVVPEPASCGALLAGLGVIAAMRRRNNSRRHAAGK